MKRPPEPPEFRTEAQVIEDAILKSCKTIRASWPDMLEAATQTSARPGGGSRSAGILADRSEPIRTAADRLTWTEDNGATHDVDPMTRLVSLRREVTILLNSWVRLIMEDRLTIDGRLVTNPKSLPLGDDVPGMCRFIETHAQWLSRHEAAPAALDELRDAATDVKAVVDPWRKEWHKIGPCPLAVDDVPCTGSVRIRVAAEDDIATCTQCGKAGRVHWWQEVMGKAKRRFVLAGEMSRILYDRLHVTASAVTVKRWAREGRIPSRFLPPMGPWPDGHPPEGDRYWLEEDVVLHEVAVMDRVCPMCGGSWSGEGQVCLRCYRAAKDARATYGDDSPAYRVIKQPKRPATLRPDLSPDERITVHDEGGQPRAKSQPRCANTDMPVRWCGCGKEHRVTA